MSYRKEKRFICLFLILAMCLSMLGIGFAQSGIQVTLTSPTSGQELKPGDQVNITGTAPNVSEVTVLVRNAKGGLVYTAQPVVTGGQFATGFKLNSDAVTGTYTVKIGGLGTETPLACNFQVRADGSGDSGTIEPSPDTILIIQGSGVDRKYYFALEDLQEATEQIVEEDYYSINNFGTKKHFSFTGVSLAYLLDELISMNSRAESVTMTAPDGYHRNYNLDDVRRDYIDETDPGKKLPMILAWEEDGEPLKGQYPLKLVMGQTKAGNVNKENWVSNVKTITVNSTPATDKGSPGSYQPSNSAEEAPVIDVGKDTIKERVALPDGRTGEKITLADTIQKTLENAENGTKIMLSSENNVDEVRAEISADIFQVIQKKQMILEVKSEAGTYSLPSAALNFESAAVQLGVKPEAIKVNVIVSKVPESLQKNLSGTLQQGQNILAAPVEFKIEFLAGDKKMEFKSFGRTYVAREIPVNGTVNQNEATGAVWNEVKGKFVTVPTRFETRNGKVYAVILKRTNSIYTVLQSKKTFADIQNNWAKQEVELLASKMIINGKSETTYEPASNITRAEFAALLVRALGLDEESLTPGQFKDICGSEWYAGSVATAVKEEIVTGYDDKTFLPNNKITRQEMAIMIARAVGAAGKEEKMTDSQTEQEIGSFTDCQSIPAWAAKEVAIAVKAGVIKGMPGGGFSPQTYADRAQSAVMLQRFLTYVNFIDSK